MWVLFQQFPSSSFSYLILLVVGISKKVNLFLIYWYIYFVTANKPQNINVSVLICFFLIKVLIPVSIILAWILESVLVCSIRVLPFVQGIELNSGSDSVDRIPKSFTKNTCKMSI